MEDFVHDLPQKIHQRIFIIRGKKVMFDSDLAELYQIQTKILNQAVSRNIERFPDDFSFILLPREWDSLRSQIVTSSSGWGGARYKHRVFTEQGIAMLSGVLRSEIAIQINIHIMRAFVKMREMITLNKELSRRLQQMEEKYDEQFADVFATLRKILDYDEEHPKRPIGF